MLTKAKRISSKIVAALCAATLLLGIFVLTTSAQEPTERANAVNPYGYGYEPITDPYLYRIPVNLSTSKGQFSCSVPRSDFLGDTVGDFEHNYAWLSVTYEGQDENGDIQTFVVNSPFVDCYYLATSFQFTIALDEPFNRVRINGSNIVFEIGYDSGYIPYPDSIVEAYVYIGLNPLRYGYDSNTSGGNTDEAYQDGYNNGLSEGYSNGYEEGYSNGYDTASSQIENSNHIKDLGEGFFNGLVDTFLTLYDVPVFGTTLGEIIGYIITALIVLFLVKVVAFVV